MKKTALVVGATGVVGRELVKQLCNNENYTRVTVWARRPYTAYAHAKLNVQLIDFNAIAHIPTERVDEIFCALGTSLKKAGSVDAFRRVDVTYPIEVARWGKRAGARRFLTVSAIGADSASPLPYFKAKGDTEKALRGLYYDSLHIVRPFLITGQRDDTRPVEHMAAWLCHRLLPRRLRRWQPSTGAQIAATMIQHARTPTPNRPTIDIYYPQDSQWYDEKRP